MRAGRTCDLPSCVTMHYCTNNIGALVLLPTKTTHFCSLHTHISIQSDDSAACSSGVPNARTTLWVEEWNVLGERSTEWRDRRIIPNASGSDEPWSAWRSLNRLRVQKGRCRAMMKMWKLSHTDLCDCGEI